MRQHQMIFKLCLLLIPGVLSTEYIRFDARDPSNPFDIEKRFVPQKSWASSKFSSAFNFLSAKLLHKPAFQFDFDCEGIDEQKCEWAEEAFKSAGERISKDLKISETIRVSATFKSYIGRKPVPKNFGASRLGVAAPSSSFSARARSGGPSVLYAQALVKQIVTDMQVPWGKHDIYADFNADVDWWYSKSGQRIGADQIDLEVVVVHELMRGLGFITHLKLPAFYIPEASPFLTTQLDLSEKASGPIKDIKVHGFLPLNSFEAKIRANITGKSCNFTELAEEVMKFEPKRPLGLHDYIQSFKKSGSAFKASEEMAECAMSQRAFLATMDPSMSPKLHPPRMFTEDMILAYLDTEAYAGTEEFLMAYGADFRGVSLDEKLKMYPNVTGVLGPMTASIMGSIGWEVKTPGIKSEELSLILDMRAVSKEQESSSLSIKPVLLLFAFSGSILLL